MFKRLDTNFTEEQSGLLLLEYQKNNHFKNFNVTQMLLLVIANKFNKFMILTLKIGINFKDSVM